MVMMLFEVLERHQLSRNLAHEVIASTDVSSQVEPGAFNYSRYNVMDDSFEFNLMILSVIHDVPKATMRMRVIRHSELARNLTLMLIAFVLPRSSKPPSPNNC